MTETISVALVKERISNYNDLAKNAYSERLEAEYRAYARCLEMLLMEDDD